jgi:hypothetical protein
VAESGDAKEIGKFVISLLPLVRNGFYDESIVEELGECLMIIGANSQGIRGGVLDALFSAHFDITPFIGKYLD